MTTKRMIMLCMICFLLLISAIEALAFLSEICCYHCKYTTLPDFILHKAI